MRRKSFSILFFLSKTRLLKNGEAPITLRISVGGNRVESQIRRSVEPDLWDQKIELCKGRDNKSAETNEYIRMLKLKALTIHRELELSGAHFTARLIMNRIYSVEKKQTLLSIFRRHNDEIRKLIGIDYQKRTVSRYDSCCRYLADMIKLKYKKEDITLAELDGRVIRNYEMHLKTVRGCQQNTVVRYMKCFKKVTNMALAEGLISRDPFFGIRFATKKIVREVLTREELEKLINREFQTKRLEHVRDVFVFCAFTGLAYIDAYNLRAKDIERDNHGDLWIKKIRQKTNVAFHVPLLNIPKLILDKYKNDPDCIRSGHLLPMSSNQKMNEYLKEIAVICDIEKNLTTHVARRTYATTVCHESGVSIENISKMLGHTNTGMTMIYTQIADTAIKRDMKQVRDIFD